MATDFFMEIAEVPGESTDSSHKGQIELMSFSNGVSQTSSGTRSSSGSGTAERVSCGDFTVTKDVDKATPIFNEKCCKGAHIPLIKIYARRAKDEAPVDFMVYELTDSVVTSVSVSAGGMGIPSETVSFNYGKIKWTYTETDDADATTGVVETNWSIIDNKSA